MKRQTAFGKFLEARGVPYEEAARDLGITRSYVGMLARGAVTPALELAFKIADWSKVKGGPYLGVETWEAHVG